MPKEYVLTLDLEDDPVLIAEYKEYHEQIWPEIEASIRDSGIEQMKIYLLGNRLMMHMIAGDSFSFERKKAMDRANPKVKQWEELMWKYQRALPQAKPGEKWMLMGKIFDLKG